MAKRESAADLSQRGAQPKKAKGTRGGGRQTAAQKAAAQENLRKGREARDRKRAEAQAAAERGEVRDTAGERWAKLLSGTITVEDLDDEELARMQVKGKDGAFNGKGRAVPSHLAQQMQREGIKRATEMFRVAAPRAVKRLLEIADDPDAKDSDAIAALRLVLERGLGKQPETVVIAEQSKWDEAQEGAFRQGVDREALGDDAGR